MTQARGGPWGGSGWAHLVGGGVVPPAPPCRVHTAACSQPVPSSLGAAEQQGTVQPHYLHLQTGRVVA